MKHFNEVKKYGAKIGASVSGALLAVPAFAGDYDSLTAAVDFADVKLALLAIGALLIIIAVARKGVRSVIGMVK